MSQTILVPQSFIDGLSINSSRKLAVHAHQLYLVEQWAAKRDRVMKTVVAYTGGVSHQIQVYSIDGKVKGTTDINGFLERLDLDTFGLDTNSSAGSSIKRKWVQINEAGSIGKLLVTSISSIPASLNLLLIPEGDYDGHMNTYYINHNLQKLGCGGRNSATFEPPQAAQRDMFAQAYMMFENKNVSGALFNMIKLIQTSLFLIDTLAVDYADGILCDYTCAAIQKFVELFRYQDLTAVMPESVCPPALLSALLSKILTYRNLLYVSGLQVTKNPFDDSESLQAAICTFQVFFIHLICLLWYLLLVLMFIFIVVRNSRKLIKLASLTNARS